MNLTKLPPLEIKLLPKGYMNMINGLFAALKPAVQQKVLGCDQLEKQYLQKIDQVI